MIRGTNAQFKFNLPYSYNAISVVKISFWQRNDAGENVELVVKTKGYCQPGKNDYELLVTLSPSETLRFSDEKKAYVQLRGSVNGYAFASKQVQISVYPVCDDSILDDDDDVVLPPPEDDGWISLDGGSIV